MARNNFAAGRTVLLLLLPVSITLITMLWKELYPAGPVSSTNSMDDVRVSENRELFSGEWAIGSLHQCSPRPLRADFSSWNRSNYRVKHCPDADARGANYKFVLLNESHPLNKLCNQESGQCDITTLQKYKCSFDFYRIDELPRLSSFEKVQYPNERPRLKIELPGSSFQLMHDALIVFNCSETVEWTVFHIRRKPVPLGPEQTSRREDAISTGGVFGSAVLPSSRKEGGGASYNTDHVTLVIIDAISRAHFMRTFAKTRSYIEGKRNGKEGYVLGGYIATGKFTMLAMTAFQIGYFNPLTPLMEYATEDGRTKGLSPRLMRARLFAMSTFQAQYARDGGMISAICSGGQGFSLLAYNWKNGQLGPHHYLNALEDKIVGLSEIFEQKTVLECTGNLRQEEYCFPVGKGVAKLYGKNKDVRLFQQLYMMGNHQGDQLYGVGWDDNLVEYLKWQDEFYTKLGQRHTTILMSDHGNQWASHKAAANERYSPLAVILSNEKFPEDVHQVLAYNELALLTSVDLHNAVLGLINKDTLPVNCRRDSIRCDVSLRNIFTNRIPHRTPREMGIPTKASPCSHEWGEESSDVSHSIIESIVHFVNAQHYPGSSCLDLEASTSFNPTIRKTTDDSMGIVRLRLRSRERHNISMLYDVELINDTPQFVEPRETYMSYQVCMPDDKSTFNKRTCLCDKFSVH